MSLFSMEIPRCLNDRYFDYKNTVYYFFISNNEFILRFEIKSNFINQLHHVY